MKPKLTVEHLPVYQPGKPIEEVKREYGLTDIIKLASNENPYGCSPKIKEAVLSQLDQVNIYPDGASMETAKAVAEQLGVEPNQLIFGAGSDEVILMIARAYLLPGDDTVMASHTFSQYKHNAEIEGAVSIEVPLKDGTHDLDAMIAAITPQTKIMWVCNPNNPTGTMVTHNQVAQFLQKVPAHIMVVLDEAYCEYNTTDVYPDGIGLLKQYPNLVLLRTFSKIYGLASLRIGFGIASPDIISTINRVRGPFNTSRAAQAAAIAAIRDEEFVRFCREENAKGIAYLTGEFDRMGLPHLPAHGNFIMVDVKQPAAPVFQGLLQKGIIVRGGHQLDFPTSIRVTVGTPEQNQTFISVLEQVLTELNVKA